jgi:hypothetical protein
MHRSRLLTAAALVAAAPAAMAADPPAAFRPPAVPLLASDPFLNVWSMADRLTDDATRHWTRREQPLVSLIRIDGKTFRLMGNDPAQTPAFPQTGVTVTPTRSIYEFEDTGVHVTLTFMTPSLPADLDVLARPVTYLTWDVRSVDGVPHTVQVYDSVSSQLAVNTPAQKVEWSRQPMGALTSLRVGTPKQGYFDVSGDDARRDWGYAVAAAPTSDAKAAAGADGALLRGFLASGTLPVDDDADMPRAADDHQPVLAFTFDLGRVAAQPVSRHMLVGYDEAYNIKFFGKPLRPYWRHTGMTTAQMFQAAEREYPDLTRRCVRFDDSLMADLARVGGPDYAQMGALAYRQSLAGNGLSADSNGKPLMFTKEISSDGDIATMDVIFPMAPLPILFSPTLAKASVLPIILYGAAPRWKFPNAPHDLGTYPVARGTDDGGEQMPVEESGNVLIMCDAIAKEEGNANFVSPYWPKISQWAQYLEQYGNDPEDQLCTDDFMGHLAHNTNLSVKAIVALAAYADLCRRRGETANAAKYSALAHKFALHWMQVADQGPASLLAFDKPGTWSQKYNLVWDKILGLNVFPASVSQKETAYYKSVLQPYGLPLDSRTHVTKSDWTVWSATLADNRPDFEALTTPMYDYLNQTTSRLPYADSYASDDISNSGMHARPVIGGVFVKMLADPALWRKWSGQDKTVVAGWAPLPVPPAVTYVVGTSITAPAPWRYVTTATAPAADWFKTGFDDSAWKTGVGAFGTGVPGPMKTGTPWNTSDIWLRRTITMPAKASPNLAFMVYHDEDVDIYVDGIPAATEAGFNNGYEALEISPEAQALLKPGATVTLAAHVHQTVGGQGFDMGIASIAQH